MATDSVPYLFARALFSPSVVVFLFPAVGGQWSLEPWWQRIEEVWQEARGFERWGAVSVLKLCHCLLGTLLFMSVAHSLEVRPPLLDPAILRGILPLPNTI